MKTAWDLKLSHLISPALVNYEFERISNLTYGNEEFKQSVKNYVPEGYVFKGFPLHVLDGDPYKIFGSILSSEIGKDILYSRGDQVNFAIRCKVYPYPQNVNSIWIMIAVKYRPIK
jgi:centrosomal protein CEP76